MGAMIYYGGAMRVSWPLADPNDGFYPVVLVKESDAEGLAYSY